MKKVATSQILLICGLVVLLAGCVMAYLKVEPLADYVLVAGALLIILRGSVRARERQDQNLEEKSEK
ncbi:MAG: hypothetical protein MJZ65_01585 [Paludibacteraceae bacterium]|nr:hypothetical protein [Paludibacteraceae bacterium]